MKSLNPYSLNVKRQVLSPGRYNRILVLPITSCKDFPSSISSGISQALQWEEYAPIIQMGKLMFRGETACAEVPSKRSWDWTPVLLWSYRLHLCWFIIHGTPWFYFCYIFEDVLPTFSLRYCSYLQKWGCGAVFLADMSPNPGVWTTPKSWQHLPRP